MNLVIENLLPVRNKQRTYAFYQYRNWQNRLLFYENQFPKSVLYTKTEKRQNRECKTEKIKSAAEIYIAPTFQ